MISHACFILKKAGQSLQKTYKQVSNQHDSAILECVPNFSEGRRPEVIAAIADAIRGVEGAKLLHIDSGASANRTVMTFAGLPEAVTEAAFRAIATAARLIDMRQHTGIHPRMGATDVCPLVPVRGISMQQAVHYARQLGERVGQELGIPVYLYEAAATRPERKNLAYIRAGEYEGFRQKIYLPEWAPDFGPQAFQPGPGQTVIGARDFLIAYNINLDTADESIAREIAAEVRESGRVVVQQGKKQRIPGRLKAVKAIGWYVPEFGRAQVSTNITHIPTTPVHQVYETVKELAAKRGVRVTGSELVGLAPLKVFTDAGAFYLPNPHAGEEELVKEAIRQLGLDDLAPFDPNQKILEYCLK